MRQWIRSHLTFANVVSLTALFVALGGTTYAATGGNFILGQSNTAGAPTSLSAPVAGKALQLTNTSTATGATALGLNTASGHPPLTVSSGAKVANLNADKLDGKNANAFLSSTPPVRIEGATSPDSIFTAVNNSGGAGVLAHSDSGLGVQGHSASSIGVYGASNQSTGVYGTSYDPSGNGVYGQNGAGGYGVRGSGHPGVYGTDPGTGNGVQGQVDNDTASGVYGQNDGMGYGVAGRSSHGTGVLGDTWNGTGVEGNSGGTGTAVQGDSPSGWAFKAVGNATETRTSNGFVKAMAYVDPYKNGSPSNDPIKQCFNSQLGPGNATPHPTDTFGVQTDCGITFTNNQNGSYALHFGFKVTDRFVSVTATSFTFGGVQSIEASTDRPGSPGEEPDRVDVWNQVDTSFYIFIY